MIKNDDAFRSVNHYSSEHILVIKIVVVLMLGLIAIYWLMVHNQPVRHDPGVIITSEPEQGPPTSEMFEVIDGYQIKDLGSFEISAKVLSKADYVSDEMAGFSPMDLALGWGVMSDQNVIDQVDVTQSYRFYHWWSNSRSVDRYQVSLNSSNIHVVPADKSVSSLLNQIKTGEVIRLMGHLVSVKDDYSNKSWTSSLVRTDTGGGACELMLVTSVEFIQIK